MSLFSGWDALLHNKNQNNKKKTIYKHFILAYKNHLWLFTVQQALNIQLYEEHSSQKNTTTLHIVSHIIFIMFSVFDLDICNIKHGVPNPPLHCSIINFSSFWVFPNPPHTHLTLQTKLKPLPAFTHLKNFLHLSCTIVNMYSSLMARIERLRNWCIN